MKKLLFLIIPIISVLGAEQIDLKTALEKSNKMMQERKLPTYKIPSRKIEKIENPEDRKDKANKIRIKNHKNKVDSKSKNIGSFYEFLSLYGKMPEKDGKLPNEKKLYKLIENGTVKIKSETVHVDSSKATR